MDSANLAICFAPNLLRQEVNDLTSIINTGKQSSIIDTLIEQQEWVFDPYPEEDAMEEDGGEGDDGNAGDQEEELELSQAAAEYSAPMVADENEYELIEEGIEARSRGVERQGDKDGSGLEEGEYEDEDEAHVELQQQTLHDYQDEILGQHEQEYRQDQEYFAVENDPHRHYESAPALKTMVAAMTTVAAPVVTATCFPPAGHVEEREEGRSLPGVSKSPF
jgi:hypothetical protein